MMSVLLARQRGIGMGEDSGAGTGGSGLFKLGRSRLLMVRSGGR
jgi:hypothetical protein